MFFNLVKPVSSVIEVLVSVKVGVNSDELSGVDFLDDGKLEKIISSCFLGSSIPICFKFVRSNISFNLSVTIFSII